MSLFLAAAALSGALLVPFTDLGPEPYAYGYFGGLWEDGQNTIPADHLKAGLARAARIQPLDVAGRPSPDGRIVFLSAGGDEASKIFASFSEAASRDSRVRQNALVFANGAEEGLTAARWIRDTDATYDRIDSLVLGASGLSPKQVQAVWLDLSNDYPYSPLPIQDGDAYRLKGNYSNALRSLKTRYPNLRVAYLSSRVYGGYSTLARNPEPYAYESVLSVRWIVVGQVLTMRIADIGPYWDTRVGDINYDHEVAPWVTWGPYFWANGSEPRADGLHWDRDDFGEDGESLSSAGAAKAGRYMLESMLRDPTTANWMTIAVQPVRQRPARH